MLSNVCLSSNLVDHFVNAFARQNDVHGNKITSFWRTKALTK